MRMLLENLLDIYQGKSLLVICFIVSMIYIVCVIKETTLRRNLIVAAFAIIFVFNNIALWIWKDLMGESILYELLYAVPVFSCIAYCVCHIIGRQKSVVMKVIVGAVAVVLICVLSSMPERIYDDVKEQNDTGMDDIEDIADFLKGSFTEIESRPVILCGQEGYDTLRSFMPYMLTAIGNDVFNDGQPDKDSDEYVALNIANADLTEDMDRVNEALENLEVEYIVFPDKDGVREYAARLGFFNVVDKQIFDLYEKQDYDLNCGIDGYIRRLYFYILKRRCTDEELNELKTLYQTGEKSFGDVAMSVINTQEYENLDYDRDTLLYWLFEAILDKTPDAGDLEFMKRYLGDIDDVHFIVEQYINSDRFYELIERGTDNEKN
jgi:hypothetical protein